MGVVDLLLVLEMFGRNEECDFYTVHGDKNHFLLFNIEPKALCARMSINEHG